MTGSSDLVPGFKFSRASYLLSLLRPQIYTDLELKVHLPFLTWWLVSYWGDSIFLTWEGSIVPHAQMSSLPEAFLLFQTVAHTSPRPTYQNLVLSQLPSVLKAWKSQIRNRPLVKRGLLAVQTVSLHGGTWLVPWAGTFSSVLAPSASWHHIWSSQSPCMQLWAPELAEVSNMPSLNFGISTTILDSMSRKRHHCKPSPLCTFLVSKIKENKNRHRKELRDSLLELEEACPQHGCQGIRGKSWKMRDRQLYF